jgi:hypothetical protein
LKRKILEIESGSAGGRKSEVKGNGVMAHSFGNPDSIPIRSMNMKQQENKIISPPSVSDSLERNAPVDDGFVDPSSENFFRLWKQN